MADYEGVDVSDRTCSVAGCNKPHYCRGWCSAHYMRWRRTGTLVTSRAERRHDIWAFVDKAGAGGCWLWLGQIKEAGYGRYKTADGRKRVAHRVIYTLLVGPIPDGLELDHLCRVRACVNPEHLEPVTTQENVARSTNPARYSILYNTCARGHELTEDNVYRNPSSPKTRRCRICSRYLARQRYMRRRSRQRTADGT